MKLTPRQKVERVVRTYFDLDDSGTQVTTLNANDVDSLMAELAELVIKAAKSK
jgi:hypothetical protein